MRIGLVAGPWIPVPPVTYGGIERVVDSLARGFAAAGHHVVLAAPSDSTCPVPPGSGHAAGPNPTGSAPPSPSSAMWPGPTRPWAIVDIIHDHTLSGPLVPAAARGGSGGDHDPRPAQRRSGGHLPRHRPQRGRHRHLPRPVLARPRRAGDAGHPPRDGRRIRPGGLGERAATCASSGGLAPTRGCSRPSWSPGRRACRCG
jgi:hypothetical protein